MFKIFKRYKFFVNKFLIKITNIRIVILRKQPRLSFFLLIIEPRLRAKLNYKKHSKYIFIFINPNESINNFLEKKYKKFSFFINLGINKSKNLNFFVKKIIYELLLKLVTGEDPFKNIITTSQLLNYDKYHKLWKGQRVINLTHKEQEEAKKFLPKSFDLNKPTVVLDYRKSDYYEILTKNKSGNVSYSKEVSDKFNYRNPNFEDYIKSIDWLIDKGYQVVKCGVGKSKVPYKKNGFYDLTSYEKNYNELLHIYLCTISKFHIIGSCGHLYLSWAFNKSTILTHDYEVPESHLVETFSVPSKYFHKGMNRYLKYSEFPIFLNRQIPIEAPITIEHPTPEEIFISVKYLCDKKFNLKSFSKEDKELYSELTKKYKYLSDQPLLPFCFSWAKKHKNLIS